MRAAIFLLLVVVLTAINVGSAVAVVRSGHAFAFVRRVPFGSTRLAAGDVAEVQVVRGDGSRQLDIVLPRHPVMAGYLLCQRVWNEDLKTAATLDRLLDAFRQEGIVVRVDFR